MGRVLGASVGDTTEWIILLALGSLALYYVKRTKPILIGLVAPHSCGKTIAESYLSTAYDLPYFRFADVLKQIAGRVWKLSDRQLYTDLKDVVDARYGCTPRSKIHELSDIVHLIEPGFVTKQALSWMGYGLHTKVGGVISDCRLPEQIDFVHENGGILLYLTRDSSKRKQAPSDHATEHHHSVRHPTRSHTIDNNGTKEELHKKIDSVLQWYGLTKPTKN
jgi:hypothetical protein